MKWGICDTETGLWLGDTTGPKLFDEDALAPDGVPLGPRASELARVAAELVDIRLDQSPGRSRPRVYQDASLRLVDEVTPRMTTLEALLRKERGTVV